MNNSMFTKKEADLLLRNWIRDRAEYYYRKDDSVSQDYVVDEVFDLMVECWINQPTLLQACRAANFDKQYIRKQLFGIREEIDEKKKQEVVDIVKDKVSSVQLSMPDLKAPQPVPDSYSDGRAMYYSFSTLDDELNLIKARKIGAKDRQKRKERAVEVLRKLHHDFRAKNGRWPEFHEVVKELKEKHPELPLKKEFQKSRTKANK